MTEKPDVLDLHARTNCIYASKPDKNKYKIGDTWTCPICHRAYVKEATPEGMTDRLKSPTMWASRL